MCAEAVPWRCHRSLIADALLVRGIHAEHILSLARRKFILSGASPKSEAAGSLIRLRMPFSRLALSIRVIARVLD